MKNLLKLTFVLFVFVGLTANVNAQQIEYNSNVAVTATVNQVIVLTPTAVTLGIIVEDLASIIDANANDDAVEANLGFGASAGNLNITGESGQSILVAWTNATLDIAATGSPVTFTPSLWIGASELTTPGGSTTSITGGDIDINIGGELDAVATPGSYDTANGSPIVFTVSYN